MTLATRAATAVVALWFVSVPITERLLVKMTSGDRSGWGETSPWASPAYSPEWAAGVFGVLRDFYRVDPREWMA